MIDIVELYNTVNDQLSKNNGRYLNAEEFTRYVNLASTDYFNEVLGRTNKRVNRQSMVGYGHNQQTDKRLEPFRTGQSVNIIDGEGELPSDLDHITTVTTSRTSAKPIKRISEDRLGSLFDNPLRKPNEDESYYLEGNQSIELFGTLDEVYVRYIKKPVKGLLAEKEVTLTAGNRTVTRMEPDPDNSVDLDWDEREMGSIVTRILSLVSKPTKDGFLAQSTQLDKANE